MEYDPEEYGLPTVVGSLHTHTMNVAQCAIPFSVRCLAWLGSLGLGGRGPAVAGTPHPKPAQPAQPATHTNVFAFVCCCCFTYIYIYMLHITQTDRQTDIDRSIDRSLSVLSLSPSLYT
jgi:hypothetical protein